MKNRQEKSFPSPFSAARPTMYRKPPSALSLIHIFVADLEQRQSDVYVHMYFTVIGGQGYNIGLYTYGQQAGFTLSLIHI